MAAQVRERKNAAIQTSRAGPALADADDTDAITGPSAADLHKAAKRDGLLYFEELPAWLQDNHYIRSGYRSESRSLWKSLKSVCAIHNETVNIWTHLVPSALFLGFLVHFSLHEVIPLATHDSAAHKHSTASGSLLHRVAAALRSPSVSSTDLLVFLIFFAGATTMFTCSWTYHTMSNHSHALAKWWNKADYLGIVCMILGSFAPSLYYGYYCDAFRLKVYLVVLNSLGGVCALVTVMDRFRTPQWRPYRAGMFCLLGLSAVVPVVEGLVSEQLALRRQSALSSVLGDRSADPLKLGLKGGIWHSMALTHTAAQGALYIFGATLYAIRFPEKWAYNKAQSDDKQAAGGKGRAKTVGRFDIWGSSHQIFHVCVVLAGLVHFWGLLEAFSYRHGVLGGMCPA